MKIEYFKGNSPNFGDELSPWLWPKLLPNFFDDDPSVLFIGIGSILGESYTEGAKKVVAGAGYVPSYHHQAPDLLNGNWEILFVRGRRTAQLLGLPESLAIGDSATLLRALNLPFHRAPRDIGFIPHWESLPRGEWQKACALAGIHLINPSLPVEQVINEILHCKILICEAMHGAIIADTLRVPWVPVIPIVQAHRDKWFDWADTLGIKLARQRLWPSSTEEVQAAIVHRPRISRLTAQFARRPLSWVAEPFIVQVAAARLSHIARQTPYLSEDGVVENLVERMLEKIRSFEKRYTTLR